MPELIGGRYSAEEVLGTGAMGVVYRAHDTVLDRTVALKELRAPPGMDPTEAVERFLTEARAGARLHHPCICTVHDVLADGDRVIMAMELLEGPTLAQAVVTAGGGLPPDVVRGVMAQVAAALAEAHGRGVVHRDLKPENIFWLATGRVVVCDFGLARIGAGGGTRVGTVMGTPGYLAPEQVRGEYAGPAADVFSWGAVAYELLTGSAAFGDAAHDDAVTLIWRVVNQDPAPLELPHDPDLAQVVAWTLAKDPSQRPNDGATLLEALGGAVAIPTITAASNSMPPHQPLGSRPPGGTGRTMAIALAGALVALAVVVGVVATRGGGDSVVVGPPPTIVDDRDLNDPDDVFRTSTTTATTVPARAEPLPTILKPIGIAASATREPVFLRCTGEEISYDAANLIDGDLNTGWGAGSGDGAGQSVVIDFGRLVQLRSIRLTPGYAKIGPRSSEGCRIVEAFRFNRFIEGVSYEFDDGSSYDMWFDNDPSLQQLDLDYDALTTKVIIRILRTSRPPGADDDTILSEVAFEGSYS